MLLLLSVRCFAGGTLYFIATLDSQGHINQSWFSANNWYIPGGGGTFIPANRLPQSDDDAVLTTTPVLCEANSISVHTLTVQGVNVVGGDFSLINLITYPSAGGVAPTFNGSTVRLQNEFELTLGPFGGATVFNGGTLNIASGAFVLLDSGTTLNMVGPSTLWDDGQIVMTGGSGLLFTGGTNQFSILPNAILSGSGTTSVVNGGSLLFDNNGDVRGDAGFMTLSMGGVIWTNSLGVGKYSTSVSNATIQFNSSYMLNAGNTNKFFGPGLIWFFGNIIAGTNNGVFRVGESDPTRGTVRWDATISGTGEMDVVGQPDSPSLFVWDGGTIGGKLALNIDGWSQLILTNTSTKTLSGATINNGGLTRWVDAGRLSLDNGAVFNNLATGVFSAENDALLQGGAGIGSNVFNNAGLFRKTNSVSYTQFLQDTPPNPGPLFMNTGTLDVESGRLLLLGGTNSGSFHLMSGAQLEFQANYANGPGGSFSGAGTNVVDQTLFLNTSTFIPNITMAGAGVIDGPGDLAIGNLLNVNNGSTIRGAGALVLNPGATFSVPSAAVSLSRNVTNGGLTTVANGTINATTNIFWTNQPSGSVALFQGASLAMNYSGVSPVFQNAGTLTTPLPNVSAQLFWTFTNSGQVSISATGQLAFNRGFTQTAGSTVVSNGGTLTLPFQTSAAILGGALSGTGKINGGVVNSGTVHPGGSPGQLTIFNGGFTNTVGGILAVELDGTNFGQYSQLNNSGGQANFGGTLSVSLANGFIPSLGDTFKIYSNGVPHGVFASLQGMHPGNGIALVPRYNASDVTLVAANEPTILSPSHSGSTSSFSFQSTAGLTNVVEFTDSLSQSNWQALTNIIGDGSLKFIVDSSANAPQRFYRIRFL